MKDKRRADAGVADKPASRPASAPRSPREARPPRPAEERPARSPRPERSERPERKSFNPNFTPDNKPAWEAPAGKKPYERKSYGPGERKSFERKDGERKQGERKPYERKEGTDRKGGFAAGAGRKGGFVKKEGFDKKGAFGKPNGEGFGKKRTFGKSAGEGFDNKKTFGKPAGEGFEKKRTFDKPAGEGFEKKSAFGKPRKDGFAPKRRETTEGDTTAPKRFGASERSDATFKPRRVADGEDASFKPRRSTERAGATFKPRSTGPRDAAPSKFRKAAGDKFGVERVERATRAPRAPRETAAERTPRAVGAETTGIPRTESTARSPRATGTAKTPKAAGAVRLNRFIATSGVCSRREADQYITAGVVTVNGQVITELGTKVAPGDDVRFNGEPLSGEQKVYILMNKPKGFVTTVEDPHADRTVIDIVKGKCDQRVYPVGRLDRNSMGVLLITNDGDLTRTLTHPSFDKKKVYQVTLDKSLTKADLESMLAGLELEDGFIRVDDASWLDAGKKEIGVEVHSGRNRVIRRIFEHLGYKVNKLDRVYFAGLTKTGLRRGAWRFLSPPEIAMLKSGRYE